MEYMYISTLNDRKGQTRQNADFEMAPKKIVLLYTSF